MAALTTTVAKPSRLRTLIGIVPRRIADDPPEKALCFTADGFTRCGCVYHVERVVINKSLQGVSLRSLQRDGYEPNDELSECMRDKKARKVKIKARATIICLRSGSILLVRKKSGKWNFPGGAIEPGESPVAAAARELQEETSIKGHGLLPLCTVQVGLTVHHVFTTHFDDRERAVARNEIVACKWVLRDKLNPAMLSATAAGLLSSQLPALSA